MKTKNNLMSNIYIGYIVEAIKENDKYTLELRVRVPSIHGVSKDFGIADKDLPIAKPLLNPGTYYDSNKFKDFVDNLNKVYVVFESGNYNNPVYLGIKGNNELYEIPIDDSPDTSPPYIKGYYNKVDNKFYKEEEFINEIEGSLDKFYIDLLSNSLFVWTNTFIELSSPEAFKDHSLLLNRDLPNQHPINAITGLKEEIGVHIGEDEPIDGSKTWFQVKTSETFKTWTTVATNLPVELSGEYLVGIGNADLIRIVVNSELWGEVIEQEETTDGAILQAVFIIRVDESLYEEEAVLVSFNFTSSKITVEQFISQGNVPVSVLNIKRVEVYR